MNQQGKVCCASSIPGLRMLTLPNGMKVGVFGLEEIFEDLYRTGKSSNMDTALEIVNRLKDMNYIAPGSQKRYKAAVLKEYQIFYDESKHDH